MAKLRGFLSNDLFFNGGYPGLFRFLLFDPESFFFFAALLILFGVGLEFRGALLISARDVESFLLQLCDFRLLFSLLFRLFFIVCSAFKRSLLLRQLVDFGFDLSKYTSEAGILAVNYGVQNFIPRDELLVLVVIDF